MTTLNELMAYLIILIRVGVLFRVIYCLTRLIYEEEERSEYNTRMRNAIVFWILAETIKNILAVTQGYFGKSAILTDSNAYPELNLDPQPPPPIPQKPIENELINNDFMNLKQYIE